MELHGNIPFNLFRQLAEHNQDEVFIVQVGPDKQAFTLVYGNSAYFNKFNMQPERVLNQDISSFVPSESIGLVKHRMATCATENTSIAYEESIDLPGGAITSLSQLFPLSNEKGAIAYVAGISKNITELKKQRDQNAELASTLQAIIDSSGDIIAFFDAAYRIVFTNNAALEHGLKYYGKRYVPGESVHDYVDEEQMKTVMLHVKEMRARNGLYEVEIHSATGSVDEWYLRRYYPVLDQNGHYIGFVLSSTDITERKKHELQIELQNQALREIAQVQSHVIRRPLANMMGLMELVNGTSISSEENEHILSMLRQSSIELDDMIRNIILKTEVSIEKK